jgi:hypothetical protein
MPDQRGSKQFIALVLMFSAVLLVALSALIYVGVVPIAEETRSMAAIVVGVAAFTDLLVAIWFFRMGQES